ncbi:MAG: tryptophan 2,3-dioxygenase [Calditrichaeota bacterium]|nr:tryptophan 2,3-dioxygenase [Calditrichota bacterium]
MAKNKAPVNYSGYLQLDRILDSQSPISEQVGKPSHDEMLFIVIHQTYELWFKQILHELESVITMFREKYVDERNIGIAVQRLHRIVEIEKVLIDQIRILETMTALDFLDFRGYLSPASGFQSFQFRMLEIRLGLKTDQRIRYSQTAYHELYEKTERDALIEAENSPSLLDMLENWLERTPFLELKGFNFLDAYSNSVEKMLADERKLLSKQKLTETELKHREQMIHMTELHFETILNQNRHDELVQNGRRRLSYKAMLAGLFINLYRDQPILHLPFKLLAEILDMDELLSTWRYRHALMVLRMLGRKTGTGGSAGYSYLKNTAESHRVFADLFNIPTFLIPRSMIPDLPKQIEKKLSFYFTQTQK